MAALDPGLDDFREYMLGQGLSHQTVRDYGRALRWCLEWFVDEGLDLREARPSQLIAYAETRPKTYGVRAQLRSALKAWWDWQGIVGFPKAILVPTPPPMISHTLETDEAAKMVETAQGWWRPGTAVLAGLFLGLRCAEIASMRWDGFDDEGWFTLVGKGAKTRTVAVPEILAAELAGREEGTPWVFEGYKDSHVSSSTVLKWTKKVAAAAGVDSNVWTHRLRHTAITAALDATGNLRAVQYWAGHSKPETTAGYARTSRRWLEMIRDELVYVGEVVSYTADTAEPEVGSDLVEAPAADSWGEDVKVPRPEEDDLRRLWDSYTEEGHLVKFLLIGEEDDGDEAVWVTMCTCGDTSNGGWIGSSIAFWMCRVLEAAAAGDLLTYEESKWWQRGHRTDHGLAWQSWSPWGELPPSGW